MKSRALAILAVVAVGLVFLTYPFKNAQAEPGTVVSISGNVTLAEGFTLQVGATASGPSNALVGQGFDSPFRGNPTATTPPGYCRFPLTGSASGNVVSLSGNVSFSNDPSNLGVAVSITADASTSAITFVFGPFTLTDTGSVVIAHE
ncbi:MAG: hypothetical protein L0196_05185 [candidate division Zixibacteria bacterium]|nr:hypothetical protein [candidate division Zixibacteria bacterium]